MTTPFASLILAALLASASPVLGQSVTVGDAFFNIANDPEITAEMPYGTARGWSVVAGFAGNRFAYCAAELSGTEGTWRFGYDASPQWQMAFTQNWSGDTPYGSIDIDGQSQGTTGWGDGRWVTLWLWAPEYEAIASGNRLSLDFGQFSRRFTLSGTAAAALKVQECVQNRGVPPRNAPAQQSAGGPVMPDPNRRGETMIGNCRTPYASYRCTATALTPTGNFGEAMLVADALGDPQQTFILQTDRRDVSQVWVSNYAGAPFVYVGEWNSDGTCRQPMANQPASVVAALGHDSWQLCIE